MPEAAVDPQGQRCVLLKHPFERLGRNARAAQGVEYPGETWPALA
ncbi:D-amino acid dehydrogenase small subunit domain protein [Bordetella holmesii ATCC 51541]|nr:D-amino acid dehydrogenase small subunit domain protein [Bordetella holmesii ATCC 51541]